MASSSEKVLLNNFTVYSKEKVEELLLAVRTNQEEALHQMQIYVDEASKGMLHYVGTARYMGAVRSFDLPDPNNLREGDLYKVINSFNANQQFLTPGEQWPAGRLIQVVRRNNYKFYDVVRSPYGNVYTITQAFDTDFNFIEGSGIHVNANSNISIIELPNTIGGSKIGFDILDTIDYGMLTGLPYYYVNETDTEDFRDDVTELLARNMTAAEARAIIEDEMAQGE